MINFNRLITFFTPVRTQLDIYRCITKRVIINSEGKDVPKERTVENKITLINPDNSISITDLKSAQNLSMRRDLKLVKIDDKDVKTKRAVYKLMTPAEYHNEEISNRKTKREENSSFIKGEKLVTLASKIGQHDLMIHVKKMVKHLEKRFEVRVVVTSQENDKDNAEKIASVIESNIKPIGKLVQKRLKGSNLKFQLLPVKEKHTESASKNESSSSDDSKSDKGPL